MQDAGSIYNKAAQAAMAGNWKTCADMYLRAYRAGDLQLQFCAWSGFTTVLREEHFVARESDIEALTMVAEDKRSTYLQRTSGFFTRGYLRCSSGDREGAIRDYRRALAEAAAAPESERNSRVILPNCQNGRFEPTLVGPLLEKYAEDSRSNLAVFTMNKGVGDPDSMARIALDQAKGYGTSIRRSHLKFGPNAPTDPLVIQTLVDEFDRRRKAGGLECDACGAAPTAATSLRKCSSCKAAFYCDKTCQQVAWTKGHKHWCRKPGFFKVGDWVRVLDHPNLETGETVVVVGVTSEGCQCSYIGGGDDSLMVSFSCIEHLRPVA